MEVFKDPELTSHDSPVISFLVALGSKSMAYRSETVTVQPCLLSSSTATFFNDPLKDLGSWCAYTISTFLPKSGEEMISLKGQFFCQNSTRTKMKMKHVGASQQLKLRNTNLLGGWQFWNQLYHSSLLLEFTNTQIYNGSNYDSSKITHPSSLKAQSILVILWEVEALFPNIKIKKYCN